MVGGLQGAEWKFIQKYLKKRSKRVGRNYREASGEHPCTVQNGCEIISQQNGDFAAVQKSSFSLE